MQPEIFRKKWVYVLSILFIILNSYLIIKEHYWGVLIPAGLLAALMFVFSLDKMLLLITFFTPLAINVDLTDAGLGISLPVEPLMFAMLIVFFLKLMYEGGIDKKTSTHTVSIIIIINLFWLFVTTLTSSHFLVSLKFMMARLWFVIPFYFMALMLFKDKKNIERFLWYYMIPLFLVVIYTTIHHSMYGFAEKPGNWVMQPFYKDHTIYGAIIAFFVPIAAIFLFSKSFSKQTRNIALIVLVGLCVALIISYSRAAWLSVIAAFGIFIILRLKIKVRWIFITFGLFLGLFFLFQNQIMFSLERNTQDSSGDFKEHVQSISNISTDASNLERINRWTCALRMFKERPFLGWGPGTYQFEYAPFQRYREKTIISTNAGDLGNAHSEYIGPLAESGVLGLLTFLAIAISVIVYGFKVYREQRDSRLRAISLGVLCALSTYFVHGVLNNFLDTDKLSVPFWGAIAVLVAIDIYHNPDNQSELEETKKEV